MTKADCVYSTPPTNTSVTRRKILGTAAVAAAALAASGAVAAAIPAAAIAAMPTTDPIYAAIERHKDLAKTFDAAWEVRGRCKDWKMTEEEEAHVQNLNDAIDEIGLPLEAAAMDLFNTAPTSHSGMIAALRYIRTQHGNGGDHMVQGWLENEDGERYVDWMDAWLETLIEAVRDLDDAAVQS
jgi:hypothetical protein